MADDKKPTEPKPAKKDDTVPVQLKGGKPTAMPLEQCHRLAETGHRAALEALGFTDAE